MNHRRGPDGPVARPAGTLYGTPRGPRTARGAEHRAHPGATTYATGGAKKSRRARRCLAGVGIGLVICLVLGLLGGGVVYYSTDLPPFPAQNQAAQNRVGVPLKDVPKHVQDAVVAAEDATFWTNDGISLHGTGRAIWGLITGNPSAGGGSTITQQYVRNALDLTLKRSYTRKLKELILAQKLSNSMSKQQILQGYLNTIYFGRGAWGIQAAARAYFGKSVEELTIAEGAVLAAVIKDPTNLDPRNNPTGAQNRWAYVLDQMVDKGLLARAVRVKQSYPITGSLLK
jgi:membrane peptidoglycan carboxypeptidase